MKILLLLVLIGYNGGEAAGGVSRRLFGGKAAGQGQFPYQVLLEMSSGWFIFRSNSLCGGSLISDSWVVTAAHCTKGASQVRVSLGIVDMKSKAGGVSVIASRHIEHPRYNQRTIKNDIALVQLRSPVSLNENINVIKLPTQSESVAGFLSGEWGVISGWGKTLPVGGVTRNLRFADVKVMGRIPCQLTYLVFGVIIDSSQVCTLNLRTLSGTCQGDSGGPLVYRSSPEADPVLVGVTSFGITSLCTVPTPSVFTYVPAFLSFIQQNTGISVGSAQ